MGIFMLQVLSNISNIMIPLIVFYIIAYGLMNGCKVYEVFVKGAKDGVKTVVGILPTLVALMTAVGILRASGFLISCRRYLHLSVICLVFLQNYFPLYL